MAGSPTSKWKRAAKQQKQIEENQLREKLAEIAASKQAMRAEHRRAIAALLDSGNLPAVPVISKLPFWRRLALRRKIALLRRSGLFDSTWYRSKNEDVAQAGVDPLVHFIAHGEREGRSTNAVFD